MKKMFNFCLAVCAILLLACSASANADKQLISAAQSGDKPDVEKALKAGADANAKDKDGNTPLHWAAMYGHKDIAELLLAKGAKVDAKNDGGMTPLHYAAEYGRKDVAELLLAHGADVNAKANEYYGGRTAVYFAAEYGHKGVAEFLLAHGADVADSDFYPPWFYEMVYADYDLINAAANGDKAGVEKALKAGADVNAKDDHGRTPLDIAKEYGRSDVIKLLESKGAR